MVQKALLSYIKEQLGKGFAPDAIRDHLLQYNYPANVVEEALRENMQPSVRHEIHFSKGVIVTLLVLALGAGLFGLSLFFISQDKSPAHLLDLKADLIQNRVASGGTLPFTVELSSLGSSTRYDVALSYYIIDDADHIVTSETETVAVETRASVRAEVDLPDTIPPGTYSLRVNARYGDQRATASQQFTLEKAVEKTLPQQPEPVLCDDQNSCTTDSVVNGQCTFTPIAPCCGNDICEESESSDTCTQDCPVSTPEADTGEPVSPEAPAAPETPRTSSSEEIDAIAQKARTDIVQAENECQALDTAYFRDLCYGEIAVASKTVRFCTRIENEREKDNCHIEMAQVLKNSRICESIGTESRRDSCYINYVSQTGEDDCDKVANNFLQASCQSLVRS